MQLSTAATELTSESIKHGHCSRIGYWRRPSLWFLLCMTSILALTQYLYFSLPWDRWVLPSTVVSIPQQAPSSQPSHIIFDANRDATNVALSRQSCEASFPDLYHEVDRAVDYWHGRNHIITLEDVDLSWRGDAMFKVLIHDNELRILETRHSYEQYQDRVLAVVHQLHRALEGAKEARDTMPTVEFSVTVDDLSLIPAGKNDAITTWTFARKLGDVNQERLWLMPDFNFWSAPIAGGTIEYEETRSLAKQHDSLLIDKIPQVIWRGARWTNEAVRGPLIDATANQTWADVKVTNWEKKENVLPMQDMCDYMFPAHTEGRSWSGRLKYLLSCNSLPVVHDLEWTAHYYHLLVASGPKQNHVRVKRDWSNLERKVKWFLKHPNDAQRVADNAVATFRDLYITPAAEACYWRRLIDGWSTVAFTPDPYEADGKGLRGIGFEEFM